MTMKRLAGTLLTGGALLITACAGALAQSTADASKEWPTYGHDPGGMRFSPLTQITPANVSQLKVAWVYHMRPAGFTATAGNAPAPSGRGAAGIEVETPDAAPGARRGGGRFG